MRSTILTPNKLPLLVGLIVLNHYWPFSRKKYKNPGWIESEIGHLELQLRPMKISLTKRLNRAKKADSS